MSPVRTALGVTERPIWERVARWDCTSVAFTIVQSLMPSSRKTTDRPSWVNARPTITPKKKESAVRYARCPPQ
jgi:hypothetical protein